MDPSLQSHTPSFVSRSATAGGLRGSSDEQGQAILADLVIGLPSYGPRVIAAIRCCSICPYWVLPLVGQSFMQLFNLYGINFYGCPLCATHSCKEVGI